MTFAYAPFSIWFIPFLSLPLFFFLVLKNPQFSGFKSGFVFGVGWFGAGISWVHVSIANFGGLPLIGSLGLMALLVGYLALFPALVIWLSNKFRRDALTPFIFAACWFLFEWLRSWFLTGFPWLSIGYSQLQGPFAAWYPLIGETGISCVMILFCCYIAKHLVNIATKSSTPLKQLVVFTLFVPTVLTLTLNNISFVKVQEDTVNMAMAQGNIKQELRWVPEQDQPTMQKYLKLTENLWHNDIILWPEAAIPKLEPLAQDYLMELDKQAFNTNTGLITGIVNYNFETSEAFNNLIVLGKRRAEDDSPEYQYLHHNRYAKHHLLPIGEFIPMENWLRGLAPIFDLPMSSFSRGNYEQANLQVNDYHFLSAICFEIAFPRQIAANLRNHTDFLVTVSNDAWFGASHGPAQHLEIARVRAAEFGLPLLRATNNGLTAFVDHTGEIIAQAPQFTEATLEAQLHRVEGMTPYRYWGDLPMWLFALLSMLMSAFRQYKFHNKSQTIV